MKNTLTARIYEILKTIVDSTAVLNHLPVEHQEELCSVLKELEQEKSL